MGTGTPAKSAAIWLFRARKKSYAKESHAQPPTVCFLAMVRILHRSPAMSIQCSISRSSRNRRGSDPANVRRLQTSGLDDFGT